MDKKIYEKIKFALNDMLELQNTGTAFNGSKIITTNTDYCDVSYSDVENEIYILIKGSDENPKDWFGKKGNFRAFDFNSDGIHDGYYNAFLDLWQALEPTIKNICNDNEVKTINIIGYSRGGGIGQVLADRLCRLRSFKKQLSNLFTFGAPPVFNFNRPPIFIYSGMKHYRVVNGYDLISTAKIYKDLNLYHTGNLIQIKQPFWHRLPWMRIIDHRLSNYQKSFLKQYT